MDAQGCSGQQVTVVALLCGLPASGKSTLAKWLVATADNIFHIEYDEVEDGLLAAFGGEASNNNNNNNNKKEEEDDDDESSSYHAREIWKRSRSKSLQLFREQLNKIDCTIDDTTTQQQQQQQDQQKSSSHIILMDDNFHLRSMRREIFRLCQHFVQERQEEAAEAKGDNDKDNNNKTVAVYFTVLWLDTPEEICLERNRSRQRTVPTEVIHRMTTTLEPPGKEHWEQCFLRIQNFSPPLQRLQQQQQEQATTTPSTTNFSSPSVLRSIQQFLTKDCIQKYDPVPPPPPPIDWEQLEEERRKTRESWLHGWDQTLRKWVGLVAQQISRKHTGQANKARKALLVKLRQILEQQQQQEKKQQQSSRMKQNDDDDDNDNYESRELLVQLPTAVQITNWFVDEMKVSSSSWTDSQIEQFRQAAVAMEDDDNNKQQK